RPTSSTTRAPSGMAAAIEGVGPQSGRQHAMHIDVVQLHIVIALGVVAIAARVADRAKRPGLPSHLPADSRLAGPSPRRAPTPLPVAEYDTARIDFDHLAGRSDDGSAPDHVLAAGLRSDAVT